MMDAVTDRNSDKGTGDTLRGIAILVAAGLALGLAHNAIGRASRPPRGLDWVKRPAVAVPLDSLGAASPAGAPTVGGDSAEATVSALPVGAAVEPPAVSTPPATPSPKPGVAKGAEGVAAPRPGDGAPAGSTAHPASDLPVIPDLDQPIQIELAQLKKLYDARAVLIVDARTSYEYEDGHIAGAVNLPYAKALAEPARIAELGEAGRPIAVYCSGGGCELSMDLAKLLLENGRRRVLVYEGGWPEWASFEYPSARGAAPGGR